MAIRGTQSGNIALALGLAVGLGALGAACSSSDGSTSTSGTTSSSSSASSGSSSSSSSSSGAGGSSSSSSSSSGAGGSGGAPAPSFVAKLDPMKGELPEGLFIDGKKAYVGLAPLGKLLTVDLPGGAVHDYGSIPTPPMNGGFLLGIVVDAAGDLFVGFGGGPGMAVKNGVYKLPAGGGAVTTPWATHAEMNFANGLYLDSSKDLFVADSGGAIFRVKPDGTTTKWASDPKLVGSDLSCKNAAPFPIGANGIVRIANDFYVSNTNLGAIVKVPINGDGTAGAAANVAGPDCDALGGVDGIAVDADGKSLIGVLNSQNKLVRIDAMGKVTTVLAGMPLDNPASVVVEGKTAYVTNSAFFDQKTPAPGLVSIPLP